MRSFKEKVIKIVQSIPRGSVLSYAEVAEKAGNKKACRVVGNLMKANRDPNIPCHRVIRSDGGVGEYNRGQKEKIRMLQSEGVNINEASKRVIRSM